jgi:putative endonuclease
MRTYAFGMFAEYFVAFFYLLKCYKIIGHRVKTRMGEIDLICERRNTIVFVEVKARSSNIDDILCKLSQQQRIKNASVLFLQRNTRYQRYNIRFDLCIVRPYSKPQIIENVW